jgi:hypothetical protein
MGLPSVTRYHRRIATVCQTLLIGISEQVEIDVRVENRLSGSRAIWYRVNNGKPLPLTAKIFRQPGLSEAMAFG